VLVENRNKIMNDLNKKNIGTGSHYPIPCHLQEGYKPFIKRGSDLTVSENISSKLLSLPLDEGINSEEIFHVCQELVKSIKAYA
jgi:dTDP-4-amino-4,6-dideoxygalactose transaminase